MWHNKILCRIHNLGRILDRHIVKESSIRFLTLGHEILTKFRYLYINMQELNRLSSLNTLEIIPFIYFFSRVGNKHFYWGHNRIASEGFFWQNFDKKYRIFADTSLNFAVTDRLQYSRWIFHLWEQSILYISAWCIICSYSEGILRHTRRYRIKYISRRQQLLA